MRSGNKVSFKNMGSSPAKNLGSFVDGERTTYAEARQAEREGGNVTYTNDEANIRNRENLKSTDPSVVSEAQSFIRNTTGKNEYKGEKGEEKEFQRAKDADRKAQLILERRKKNLAKKGKDAGLMDSEGRKGSSGKIRAEKSFEEENKKIKTKEGKLKDGTPTTQVKGASTTITTGDNKNNPVTKKSPYTKSYKEAYKNADKKKYKTEAEFVKAAKAYNTKKYGSTEPTRESKKLVGQYKGNMTNANKVTKSSAKKELENRHTAKKEGDIALKRNAEKVAADVKKGKATYTKNSKGEDAVDYRKPEPKTKKRTKAGKISTKVANIFRGKGKKKDPNRKKV